MRTTMHTVCILSRVEYIFVSILASYFIEYYYVVLEYFYSMQSSTRVVVMHTTTS